MPNAKMQNAKCKMHSGQDPRNGTLGTRQYEGATRGAQRLTFLILNMLMDGVRAYFLWTMNDRGHERDVRPLEELGLNIISGHAGDVAKRVACEAAHGAALPTEELERGISAAHLLDDEADAPRRHALARHSALRAHDVLHDRAAGWSGCGASR